MDKSIRILLFYVVAVVINTILILGLFLLLALVFQDFLNSGEEQTQKTAWILVLVGCFGGSFTIYNLILKWVNKKWNLEKLIGRTMFGRKK